jgi:hypothetical protein
LVDLSSMPDTDVTAQNAGLEFADAVRERGLELWLAGGRERPAEMLSAQDWSRVSFRTSTRR